MMKRKRSRERQTISDGRIIEMGRCQRVSYSKTVFVTPFIAAAIFFFISVEKVVAITLAEANEFSNSHLDHTRSRYCDFSNSNKMYNITDLLLCMNELASNAVTHSRYARSSDGRDLPLMSSRQGQYYNPQYQPPQNNYPPKTSNDYQNYYDRRPNIGDNSGYYDPDTRYPYTPKTLLTSSGVGNGLFNALNSISQYDDLKCVPRLLCEVASGVLPGSSGYKQGYDDFGGNPLIRLLTTLDIGGSSSPLLTFGKSALTGYTSRGNPSVCYRDYPKCPRNTADVVNYLNNHNGGFFRFFGNNRGQGGQYPQGNYYRGALRDPAAPPRFSGLEADHTGTGELKFDNSASFVKRDFAKNFFPDRPESKESSKIVFPQEPLQEQSLNRVSKSLSGYQETDNVYQNLPFFPQDRKDQESNMLYSSSLGIQMPQNQARARSSRMMGSPKAKLYLPDDPSNETLSSFTFPDGQKVQINVAFSKLFSEGYKKALRRSFANDHGPQPVNFEGFSMVNLAELYPNDRNRLDLQVVHPCDMICHDSKGTPVQFNQILLHSGSLSTLMAPDQPILDLSSPLPCEVMCIDRRGERRPFSTTLNQVLRTSYDRTNQPSDFMDLQDNSENQEYPWINRLQRRRNLHYRDVKDTVPQSSQKQHDHRYFVSVPTDDEEKRASQKTQSQLHTTKIRDTGKTVNNEESGNVNDKAASMPEGSIIIGNGPMPFFGQPMPFLGLAEMSQGGPGFIPPGSSGPLGLGMPPMPSDIGIVDSLGMMPMFPEIMPMMDPLAAGMASMLPVSPPPTIVCTDPSCSSFSESPTRALIMCSGVLHFIPFDIFVILPICAIQLESGNDNFGHNGPQQNSPSLVESSTSSNNLPGRMDVTMEDYQATPATTHKFRQPEGEDYPQISCLEGESWNLDVHECVPIKYDKDIETDYTHLPGSPWSGVTRKPIKTHKLKKRKKLVIITDKGNITYIKAV